MKIDKKTALVDVIVFLVMTWVTLGTAYATSLEEFHAAIQEKNARWVAGRTTVSELPDELRRLRLGVIFSAQREKAPEYAPRLTGELPSYWDWRDTGKVTPIKDQGNCGSCWAFASVAALESLGMIEMRLSSPDDSEQFVVSYNLKNSGCDGGIMSRVYRFLGRPGTITEACMPYRANDRKRPPPCSGWRNELAGIRAWSWVTQTVDSLKTAIYENPIPAAYNVYTDFYYYTGGVYEYVSGALEGGHAILIVGWDDAEQCFIVKNSWGTGWGESGYFRIAYSQISNIVDFGRDAADFDSVPRY